MRGSTRGMRLAALLVIAISLVLMQCTALASGANVQNGKEGGVIVTENADSATGYTVTFTYYNDQATNVNIRGGFQFYVENDENVYGIGYNLPEGDAMANYLLKPEDWNKDANLWHVGDQGYIEPMRKDSETGAWTYSLDLTGGSYVYQYDVSYDNGTNYESIVDPENIPFCNTIGAKQTRSQFYIPYNPEKQSENDNWTWVLPAEKEEDRGTLVRNTYMSANEVARPVEVYLPANYDANRNEPYKVLYLSHGAGGDEADWFYQGNAGNVVDRLAADGACEAFIMVAMNNTQLEWDFDAIIDNVKNYLIPFMEKSFNVSTEPDGRAFGGLSMGAMTTSKMLYDDPEFFGYYGIFSGSRVYEFPELSDYSKYMVPNLYLAAGWQDHALINKSLSFAYHGERDMTTIGLAEKLDELSIPYNNGNGYVIVQGGHDWFTWPQIIRDYARTTLWK